MRFLMNSPVPMAVLAVAMWSLVLPGNAAPQLYYRVRREVAPPAEGAEAVADTAEQNRPEPLSPDDSRRGRQLTEDTFTRYETNRASKDLPEKQRTDKSIAFYDFLRPPYFDIENEVLSRTTPDRGNFPDSPIYYIRLPPTPYMFVPGLGYVSPPPPSPSISPFINVPIDFVANGKPGNVYHWSTPSNGFQKPMGKPDLHFVSNGKPTSVYSPGQPQGTDKFSQSFRPGYRPQAEPSLGKPSSVFRPAFDSDTPESVLEFVSNGKPSTSLFRPSYEESVSPGDSTIYRPLYEVASRPKPASNVHNLNKGPYVFNGRPSDIYLLRNSYNALYEDALQNFYP